MPHQDSWTTRLTEYIAQVLPWARGHQLKGIATFVEAISDKQTDTQAELARGLGNQEAAVKRLARVLHNERLAPHRLADAVLVQALRQLPPKGKVRLAIDWTIEGHQHPSVSWAVWPIVKVPPSGGGYPVEDSDQPAMGGVDGINKAVQYCQTGSV